MSQNADHASNTALAQAISTRRYGQVAYMTPTMALLDDWPDKPSSSCPNGRCKSRRGCQCRKYQPVPLAFNPSLTSLTWRYKAVGAYTTTTTAVRRQIKVAGRRKTVTEIRTHEDREGHRLELAFGTHGPSLQEVSDALAVERFLRDAKGQAVYKAAGKGRKAIGSVWRMAA